MLVRVVVVTSVRLRRVVLSVRVRVCLVPRRCRGRLALDVEQRRRVQEGRPPGQESCRGAVLAGVTRGRRVRVSPRAAGAAAGVGVLVRGLGQR